jgi:hypothetical protein
VPTSGRRRLGVRISQDVWVDEVERLSARSQARVAAERERPRLERDGVELTQLCETDVAYGAQTCIRRRADIAESRLTAFVC